MKTNKKAISLIVLVITIIVLSILAATVIISLSNTNIIDMASKSAFKSDMANYKQAAEVYMASEMARNHTGDSSGINMESSEFTTYFDVPEKYAGKLSIVGGKLVYETEVESEIDVLEEMGIANSVTSGDGEPVALAAGLYNGDTFTSWEELVQAKTITVSNGTITNFSQTVSGELIIPSSITSIGNNGSVGWINLSKITIPSSVTIIANDAFVSCDLLTSIEIPDSVTSLGTGVFSCCAVLISVKLPQGIASIPDGTFAQSSALKNVVISDNVTSIGNYAFDGCTELTDIYYTGTQTEWNAITIAQGNEPLTNATIHYNYVIE